MSQQTQLPTLQDFRIHQKWPAKNPDAIQLYSFPTPNGQKVSIMLEETGLTYEPHLIPFGEEGVRSPEFMALNPNNKIPAIIDPHGPDGTPIGLFESGAILVYLARKSGQLLGENDHERYEILQWLMFQMGGVGPMFGQLGYFHMFGGKDMEDKHALERYAEETRRLLEVVDKRLEGRDWLAEHYSIADIATAPWVNTVEKFYQAGDMVGLPEFNNVMNYLERFNNRPAVARGQNVPYFDWSSLSS